MTTKKFQAALAALFALGYAGTALAVGPDQLELYFSGEALWLHRDSPDGKTIATDDSGLDDGTTLLELGDLEVGFEDGMRITAGMRTGPHAFELIYYGLHEWSDSETQIGSDEGHLDDQFDTFLDEEDIFRFFPNCCSFEQDDPFENVRRADIDLESELDTVEFNYRHTLPDWMGFSSDALVGFRWIGIDEGFGMFTDDDDPLGPNVPSLIGCCGPMGPPTNDFGFLNVSTENDLYGVQFGILSRRGFDVSLPFLGDATATVGLRLKTGLYGNDANQDTSLIGFQQVLVDENEDRNEFASSVEAGLKLGLEIHGVMLTVGYEVLHVSGLALAEDNIPRINATGGFSDLDLNGNALFHGPSLGLAIAFDAGSIELPNLFP